MVRDRSADEGVDLLPAADVGLVKGAVPPARLMSSSVAAPPSTGSSVMSAITTAAPSPAKLSAIARPIPELPPVTTATLPASRLDIGFATPLPLSSFGL